MSTLTAMPTEFESGTLVEFTTGFSDYPAGTYTASLALSGPSVFSFAGTTSGTSFAFAIPAATQLLPGDYPWAINVTKVGDALKVYRADTGVSRVTANVALSGAGDLTSFDAKALALIEAQLLARYAADVQSYSIEQRAKVLLDIKDLESARGRYLRAIEARRSKGRFLTPVEITFGSKA